MRTDSLSETCVLTISNSDQSLQANAGEIILLRGECGSGKTVWLNRLAGLIDLPPDISASIAGSKPGSESRSTRLLFDRQPQLWLGQTVNEELCFGLQEMPSTDTLNATLTSWGLHATALTTDPGQLNRLQALRLNLAAIALASPDLALLDSPTDGIHETDAKAVCERIKAWVDESKTTVVVASNRWHDWLPVATQVWRVGAAEDLPQQEGRNG